jgi:hypothetical protein
VQDAHLAGLQNQLIGAEEVGQEPVEDAQAALRVQPGGSQATRVGFWRQDLRTP